MNIAFAFSPNWSHYVSITLYSLFKNNNGDIRVYLLSDELTSDELIELQCVCRYFGKRVEMRYIDMTSCYQRIKPNNINADGAYGKHALYRLFLPYIIPSEKVLYLDSDLIILSNIVELYNIDLGNNLLAGAIDIGLKPEYKEFIGLNRDDLYVNSGVLLMNLKKIREDNLFFKMIELSNTLLSYAPDQDILNKTCNKKIKIIDNKYNSSISTGFSDEIKILHYTGLKPFSSKDVPYYNKWEELEKEYNECFS